MESKLAPPSRLPIASSPLPEAPFFDSAQNAWVLSRYRDVLAALREPALRQDGPERAPAQVRTNLLNTLSSSKLSEWEKQCEPLAARIIEELPDGPVDLVSEILRPWSHAVTVNGLGLDAAAGRKLATLQSLLNGAAADPLAQKGSRRAFKSLFVAVERRIAKARLQRLLRSVRVRGAHSLFLGLSQTLPDFLANAWLVLLQHPLQFARLRAEPDLVPKTIEELLRYSGPVHTLVRKAEQALELAGVPIAHGDRVILKVALANRDPEHFTDPNSFDITRHNAGHLALGAGPHSCVGAQLVRVAAISATRAFAKKLAGAELVEPVVWRRGSTLDSPSFLRVRYESEAIKFPSPG